MDDYYKKNLKYLLDNLKRIDTLIAMEIIRFRENNNNAFNTFQGAFVSDEEIDSILFSENELDYQSNEMVDLENSLRYLILNIEETKFEAVKKGIELKLLSLGELFNLTDFELDCLLVCLAVAIDKKYEKIYGYLNDDITQKQATVDLILNLLGFNKDEKPYQLKYFEKSENLFKYNLLEFLGDDSLSLLSKPLKIDDRIANHLLGFNNLDSKIANEINLFNDNINLDDLFLAESSEKSINNLEKYHEEDNNLIVLIQGNLFHGKKTIARIISSKWKIPLLEFDISYLINENDFENIISYIFRESLLQNSALYLEHFEVLFNNDEKKHAKNIIFKALKEHKGTIFLGTEVSIKNLEKIGKKFFKIEIPEFNYFLRKKAWKKYLESFDFNDSEINELTNKFKFTPSQIKNIAMSVENLLAIGDKEKIILDDIYSLCRNQFNESLSGLARKVELKFKWKDLILPEDKKEQLIELKNYIKNKGIVFYDWGFDDKLSLAKGTNILFSGTSGTGKTMAASVIATNLGLDIYKIDLSMIVSKYVGETEKNLNKVFKETEDSDAILFFDEADALFGKRTDVSNSHDRYSNIEVSYLLQKMEEHEGIVIMATNLSKNMDDAFLRRIHFSVEFPFPDCESRKAIWEQTFPSADLRENDIDFDFLANNFKLSGSNIKNVIVSAAFLAAEDSKKINMNHIIHGIKREYQKLGKAYSQSDFGEYFE